MNRQWIVMLMGVLALSRAALAEDKKVDVAVTADVKYPNGESRKGPHTRPDVKGGCPFSTGGFSAEFRENSLILHFSGLVVRRSDPGSRADCRLAVPFRWNRQPESFRPTYAHVRGVQGSSQPTTSAEFSTQVSRFYSGSLENEQKLHQRTAMSLAAYGQNWAFDKWMPLAFPEYFQFTYSSETPVVGIDFSVLLQDTQDRRESDWVRIDSVEYILEWASGL